MLRALLVAALMLCAANAFAQPPAVRLGGASIVATAGSWTIDAGIIPTWVRLELDYAEERVDVYVIAMRAEDPSCRRACGAGARVRASPRSG